VKRSFALLALALLAAAPPPRPIAIVINGDVLAINPGPRFEKKVLYVPVRRTIEALGLPFDRSGNHIVTQVGANTVTLTIGSNVAQTNGQRFTLEGPTLELASVLYVPIRFFTDVLGAQAHFDRRSNSVIIIAQLVGRSTRGLISIGGGGFERFGTVEGVDVISDPPTITLGFNGGVKTIHVANNVSVDMEDVNVNVSSPGELGDVRPGDFARVDMRKDGRVERIVDEYGSRNGRIVAIGGDEFVLDDGHVISGGRTAEVALNGKAAGFTDLQPGDVVNVRYNVETNEIREVLASRKIAAVSGQQVAIDSVDTDANHPLRSGDTIHVTMHGTPHGSATFDIGSDVVNQAMREESAGTYAGSYVIPRGANFADVALIGRLTIGTATAQAAAPATISASSVPPGIADFAPDEGSTINTNQPAVFASFSADAVPVNPSSALLWINGRDVTSQCMRTAQFISYFPSYEYPNGPVRVTVRVSDLAGNTTMKSWSFTIRGR
jgi:hypothetical protein